MKLKYLSAPYLVWMIVFILVPLIMIAYFAFTTDGGQLTLKYVSDVGQYANIFIRSIWLSLIATAICLVVAYPVAFILSRMEKHKQGTMLMIVMLPMWMNFLLRTYAWMTLLGNNGIINYLLGLFGLGVDDRHIGHVHDHRLGDFPHAVDADSRKSSQNR